MVPQKRNREKPFQPSRRLASSWSCSLAMRQAPRKWLRLARFLAEPATFRKIGALRADRVDLDHRWAGPARPCGGRTQIFRPELALRRRRLQCEPNFDQQAG